MKSRRAEAEDDPTDERSRLLPKHGNVSEPGTLQNGEVYTPVDEGKSKSSLVWVEFKVLSKGSIPVIMAYALQSSLQTVSVIIVGRLSPESLAVAAFSYMFAMWAPIATGIAYWLSFLLLLAYARYVRGWEHWGGWSRRCLHHMGTFARLAILGVIHVGTEWWAFEIVALAAGRLGTIPLAAQSVIMTSDQVMNTVPFGVGVAASARVGNFLGARNAKGAARAANTAACLSMVLGAVVLIILMASKENFARIFNDDDRVVKLTAQVLPYVALFQIADGLNGSCGGSLRGMGRQHIGAAVNILSYYCGALPLGVYLAFHGWGLKGLWVGQCIALYIVGILEWTIVAFSDWNHEVKKAFDRMDKGELVESGVGVAQEDGRA
ncbi:MAG: hypothetical protein Q9163_002681 [Psora crenata]